MKSLILLLLGLILGALPGVARPKIDVIYMTNGDKLTGEIKKLDRGVLYFSLDYVDGTISMQWSKIARVESPQEFTVLTAGGAVYTGSLKTPAAETDRPVSIEIVEEQGKEVALRRSEIVGVGQTTDVFWNRFSLALSGGWIYSKGNNNNQYNLSSSLAYKRPRWTAGADYSSNLSSSDGASNSSRNQLNLSTLRLLRRDNWYYTGIGSLLQSSEQSIALQGTVGGGIGRLFKNTNRTRIALTGGLALQNTNYVAGVVPEGDTKLVAGLVQFGWQIQKFKQTNLNLTTSLLPALSEPGRVQFNSNINYSIQIVNNLWWTLTFYSNYDNRPPLAKSGTDYGSSVNVTYTFN